MGADQECAGMVAVVTGASRGIGAAIAQRLALAGARVAAVARTLEPDPKYQGTLQETVARITDAGGEAVAVKADLSNGEDRHRIVEETERLLGPVDILVNNAAVIWLTPATEMPEKRSHLMFEIQVRAPLILSQLVIPGMRERGRGWILNISSGASRHPVGPPYMDLHARGVITVYGMCKAALERMTTGFAVELLDDGIAVNALSPTRLVATSGARAHFEDRIARGELEGPEVIAEAAVALCSGDPRTMTCRIASSQELVTELGRTPLRFEA